MIFINTKIRNTIQALVLISFSTFFISCSEKTNTEAPFEVTGSYAKRGTVASSFVVGAFSGSQKRTVEFNKLGLPKVVEYDFKACVSDKGSQRALVGENFVLSDGINSRNILSNESGCLVWTETFQFDIFEDEGYIEFVRFITGSNGITGTIETDVAINPWTGAVFDLSTPSAIVNQVIKNKSSMTSYNRGLLSTENLGKSNEYPLVDQNSLALDYKGHAMNEVEIDKNLNLYFAYNYRLRFNPKIFTKGLNDLRRVYQPKAGKIKLSVIFLRERVANPDLSDFSNYITHFEKEFDVTTDEVEEDFVLKISQIDAVDVRIRALVKILPVSDSPLIKPGYFEGILGPLPTRASIDLVPTEYNVDDILAQFVNQMQKVDEQLESKKDLILGDGNLPYTNRAKLAEYIDRAIRAEDYRAPASLDNILTEGTALQYEQHTDRNFGICNKYSSDSLYQKCMNAVSRYFGRVGKDVNIVKSVLSKPRRVGGGLGWEEEFDFSVAMSDGVSWGWSGGLSAGGKIGFGADRSVGPVPKDPSPRPVPIPGTGGQLNPMSWLIPFGVNAGANFGVSVSRSRSNSRGVSASRSVSISVEKVTFEFDAIFELCSGILPSQDYWSLDKEGALYCEEQDERGTFRESYYYIKFHGSGSNLTTDVSSSGANPIRFVIRGDREYQQFKQEVTKRDNILVLLDINSFNDQGEATELFQGYSNMSQFVPGVLSLSQ